MKPTLTIQRGVIASLLSLVYRVSLLNTDDALWPQSIVSICAYVESYCPPNTP